MYGIDKTKLSKLYVECIDLDKLKSNSNITIKEATDKTSFTKKILIDTTDHNMIELEYLKIKDYEETSKTKRGFLFNEFTLGVASKNNTDIPYCTLDITIHDETDNNLNPQDVSTYHNRLERIKSYLSARYGVYISYENAIFSSLEINITQLMNYTFDEYYHILTLMQFLAPKMYKDKPKPNKSKLPLYLSNTGEIETLYLSNSSTEIKIYNKSKQLDEYYQIKVRGEYMRIEYKLKTSQRVKRAFNSNKLYELTDEQILNFLHERIYKDLIKNLEKHIEYSTKQLQKLFKTVRTNNKHNFLTIFISDAHSEKINNDKSSSLDLLFDKQQIIDIVSNFDKKHKKRNTELINKKSNKVKFHNNFEKLEEIKLKFTNYKKEDGTQ